MQTVGNFPFDFTTTAFPTNCNIPTTSDSSRKSVNVVACEPKWRLQGSPIYVPHLPATSISLYIPSGQLWTTLVGPNTDGPAILAKNDVSNYVVGVTINVTNQDCGTGGDCVKLSENDPTTDPQLTDVCARFAQTSTNATTGVIQGYSDLVLNNLYWPSASSERLHRTISHELAHGLGLFHNDCSSADSLMSPVSGGSVYAACTSLNTGDAVSPTTNDVLPTKNSTYSGKVRTVCGF